MKLYTNTKNAKCINSEPSKIKSKCSIKMKKDLACKLPVRPSSQCSSGYGCIFSWDRGTLYFGFFLLPIPNRICWKLFKGLGFGNKPQGRWISRQWVGEKVKKTTYCIVLCTLTFSAVHLRIYLLYSSVFYIYIYAFLLWENSSLVWLYSSLINLCLWTTITTGNQ